MQLCCRVAQPLTCVCLQSRKILQLLRLRQIHNGVFVKVGPLHELFASLNAPALAHSYN